MRVLPLLLRPRILSLKNRWFHSGRKHGKEYVSTAASLFMMVAIFFSTRSALEDTTKMFAGSVIDPAVPLNLVLTTLFLMLTLSSSVTALGALFLSKDLELILAAPLSKKKFITGKCAEVAFASSWMFVVFALPSIWAFGSFFKAAPVFYLLSPFITAILLLIPTMLAVLFASLFGALVPPHRGRDIFLVLFMLSLLMFFLFLGGPVELTDPSTQSESLLRFSKVSFASHIPWFPTTLCAGALTDLVYNRVFGSLSFVMLSAVLVVSLFLVIQYVIDYTYERAFSQAQSHRSGFTINSKLSYHISRWIFPGLSPFKRALITKEFKLFSRDISHTVQLGMLLGICFIYLYNFRALRKPENLAPEFIDWWHAFLMLSNVALSAMVVASICTRFVFPSVSMEGASFWILQSAPLSLKEVLRTKFQAWFIPLAIIGSVIFISGALALNADGPLVLATCIAGIILSYGLVGLSIGIGAIFSQFDWEYSAQITTTVGSFTLMFASVVLLGIDMVPLGFMFVSHLLIPGSDPNSVNWLALTSCLVALFLINRLVTHIALTMGEKALKPSDLSSR